jgi:hypothetical protein
MVQKLIARADQIWPPTGGWGGKSKFVNRLKPGQLTKTLDGEPVGTVVYRDKEDEAN